MLPKLSHSLREPIPFNRLSSKNNSNKHFKINTTTDEQIELTFTVIIITAYKFIEFALPDYDGP